MRTALRTLALGLVLVVAVAVGASVAAAAGPLDTTERATLLSMREEEKLAHDVYVALAARTGEQAFLKIAAAEERHGAALERMLTLYGIADSTDGYAVGKFPTAATQKLYDDLLAQGSASRAAAIQVGVSIEKMDIADLKAAIAQTDEAALDRVYGSLLAGSQRHLLAFEHNLTCDAATCGQAGKAGAGKGARAGNGNGTGRVAQGSGRQAGTGACDGTGSTARDGTGSTARDGSGGRAGAGSGARYGAAA